MGCGTNLWIESQKHLMSIFDKTRSASGRQEKSKGIFKVLRMR